VFDFVSGFDELQKVLVDSVLKGGAHTMGSAFIDLKCRSLNQFGGQKGRVANCHDLVIVPVKNQGWHIECLEIFGLISFRECLNAEVTRRESCHHRLEPK